MDKSYSPLVFVEFTFGDQSQSVVGNYTHKGKQIQWFTPAKRSHNKYNYNKKPISSIYFFMLYKLYSIINTRISIIKF